MTNKVPYSTQYSFTATVNVHPCEPSPMCELVEILDQIDEFQKDRCLKRKEGQEPEMSYGVMDEVLSVTRAYIDYFCHELDWNSKYPNTKGCLTDFAKHILESESKPKDSENLKTPDVDWENASDEDIAKHMATPAGQCEVIEGFLNQDANGLHKPLKPVTWGELHYRIDKATRTDPDHMKRPVDLHDHFTGHAHTMVTTDRGVLESVCYCT